MDKAIKHSYDSGNKWPWDAPWDVPDYDDSKEIPRANYWYYKAARGVVHEITSRNGLDLDIDVETRIEIVGALAQIILYAHQVFLEGDSPDEQDSPNNG